MADGRKLMLGFSTLFASFVVLSATLNTEPDETYRCPVALTRNRYLKSHQGKCYQFVHEQMYWTSARDYCRHRMGNLITIRRRDIQTFVEMTLYDLHWGRNGLWIGAHDRDSEGTWKWVTGESIHSGYQNWDDGQPVCWIPFKSLCKEDCACLRLDEGYRWHDYFCAASGFEYSFVCEYDMVRPKSSTSILRKTTALASRMKVPTTSTTKGKPTSTEKPTVKTIPIYTDGVVNIGKLPAGDLKDKEGKTEKSETDEVYTVIDPENAGYVERERLTNDQEAERLTSDEGGLKTGSMVGMVVSFVLVFIAGLIVGLFFCKRRARKRYMAANDAISPSFNNVFYTDTPSGTGVGTKDNNVLLATSDFHDYECLDDDEEPRYADIEDILPPCCNDDSTCSADTTDATTSKASVVDMPKETDDCGPSDQAGPSASPTDPTPCPGGSESSTNVARFAVEFLEKDTDVFQAYSNNLYDVVKS